MPRKLLDEQGNEVEVPSQEELDALKKKAEEADTAKAAWEEEKKKLEEEVNPNWRAAREKEKLWEEKEQKYKEALAAAGKSLDEPKGIASDEVVKIAQKTAMEAMVAAKRDEILSRHDAETRKVVRHYFDKLTTGEELTAVNIQDFIEAAENAAGVPDGKRQRHQISGAPPRTGVDDTSAKQMGSEWFGHTEEDFKKADPTVRLG